LRVQVGQRALQDFAMTRILGSFELLKHILARQKQTLVLALVGDLSGTSRQPGQARSGECLSLLILNRLAFPSPRHSEIIIAPAIGMAILVELVDISG
jgi:hypothetical protein